MTEIHDDEIELIHLLHVLWKRKTMIAGIVVLTTLLTFFFATIKYPVINVASCLVELNFPGIEKHQNPDKTLFEPSQMISPKILTKAIDSLTKEKGFAWEEDFNEAIRRNISVQEVIPEEIQANIKAALKKGEKFEYFPNEYYIQLTLDPTYNLSNDQGKKILTRIFEEYRSYFYERFGKQPLVSINFPENFMETYDFNEINKIFKMNIDKLISNLEEKIEFIGFFKSVETGYSFADIKTRLLLIRDIELPKMNAIINTLQITKNIAGLEKQYQYKIELLEKNKQKYELQAKTTHNLLQEMRKSQASNNNSGTDQRALPASSNMVLDSSFIENMKKEDSISFLLKSYLKADIEAINTQVDIEYIRNKLKSLKNLGTAKKEQGGSAAYVLEKMPVIKNSIVTYSHLANSMNIEHLTETLKSAIKLTSQPETYAHRDQSIMKILLLAFLASGFMAVFIAFFVEYISNASLSKEKHPENANVASIHDMDKTARGKASTE